MKKKYVNLWALLITAFCALAFLWSQVLKIADLAGDRLHGYALATETLKPKVVSINPSMRDGYIANPGMGWQRDNSTYSDSLPETVVYSRSEITWRDLNPAQGQYNWTPLDEQLSLAVRDGKQFSFRVFTVAGEIYGGHHVPDWVLEKGAVILPSGEPDYSNCIYQEEWGTFVNTLLQRYDGNPNIVFIDISGYGNFNEWSWQDQTEWDWLWEQSLARGTASAYTMENLDGEARRRLADMFIGGSFETHRCRLSNGAINIVEYSYSGAQKTQLLMPFAGIVQSAQYVFSKRDDIGFRFDCLGRQDEVPFDEFSHTWLQAPVVYEFCGSDDFDSATAWEYISGTHPILIHNNDYQGSPDDLRQLILPVGYRFFLQEASSYSSVDAGGALSLSMVWQNLGTSPIYEKMSHDFGLHVYLIDKAQQQVVVDQVVDVDLSEWLPADPFLTLAAPKQTMELFVSIPSGVPAGGYVLAVSIIDNRTDAPLNLAMDGEYLAGAFVLFDVYVK